MFDSHVVVNLTIDPEGVYLRGYLVKKNSDAQAVQLIASEYGLPYSGAERPFKYGLAGVSNADCFVMGSSRSFQISLRKEGWLPSDCSTLANLGVSGGSLEDMLILTDGLRNKNFSRVYLVVDPWGLNTHLPSRWAGYEDNFARMASNLGVEFPSRATNLTERVKNVANFDYFLASLRRIKNLGSEALPRLDYTPLPEVPRFDHEKGIADAVTLPDGSHVYNADFISKHQVPDLSRRNYRSNQVVVDPLGVEALNKLIIHYEELGIKVDLVLSPYHHAVFKDDNHEYREKIVAVEEAVRQIAADRGVMARGSYDPRQVGCHESEFFDAFHPTIHCMSRISLY